MDSPGLITKLKTAIPWILWHVWKNQNSIIYAQKQCALIRVIEQAFEDATLWFEVHNKTEEGNISGSRNMDQATSEFKLEKHIFA